MEDKKIIKFIKNNWIVKQEPNYALHFIILVLSLILILIALKSSATTMTATVEENEINHCVGVLRDAGYIK